MLQSRFYHVAKPFGNAAIKANVMRVTAIRHPSFVLRNRLTVSSAEASISQRNFASFFHTLVRPSPKAILGNEKMPARPKRHFSKLAECADDEKLVTLKFQDNSSASFHHVWLRDHCPCSECYHPVTYQRQIDTYTIPMDIRPKSVSSSPETVTIEWPDGHVSCFDNEWLYRNRYGKPYSCYDIKDIDKHLWNGAEFKDVPDSIFNEVMADDEKLYEFLVKLVKYGIVFIDGVEEPYSDALEKLGNRIGHCQRTHFGDVWTFTSGNVDFADTAYLSIKLECHNDGTYFHESPGLQLLHCNFHTGEGGENVFVDGFYVTEQLKRIDPDAFNFLASTKIPSYYYEKDSYVFKAYDTIIKLDEFDKQIYQIRFNSNDRDILSCLSLEEVEKFYKASHSLTSLIRQPSNELIVRPKPGRAALFDNWRVFHARHSFTGKRQMTGYYVQRNTFLSKVLSLREKLSKVEGNA